MTSKLADFNQRPGDTLHPDKRIHQLLAAPWIANGPSIRVQLHDIQLHADVHLDRASAHVGARAAVLGRQHGFFWGVLLEIR